MHPTDGALRRALDEPASLPDADRDHVTTCARCRDALTDALADRDAAQALLTVSQPDSASAARAWQQLGAALRADPAPQAAGRSSARPRHRRLPRATALTAAGAVLVIGGATAAAANDWLPVFRTESVAPVSVALSASDVTDLATLADLSDLSAYGHWQQLTSPQLRAVPDASAAEQRTGLDVTELTGLPTGVTGEPSFHVVAKQTAVFVFSADKAKQSVTAAGGTLPSLADALDGAALRLQAGPGVLQMWQQPSGLPTLVVAAMGAPTAESSGVSLQVLRDALLSLPGMPPSLAEQLRAVTSDGTTLPIPVPADEYTTSTTQVGGAPATLLESRDGTMTGVVWVTDGVVRLVAGPLSTAEVLSVADELG
jgi:hypothetical protein